jgi:hypothetical protein
VTSFITVPCITAATENGKCQSPKRKQSAQATRRTLCGVDETLHRQLIALVSVGEGVL